MTLPRIEIEPIVQPAQEEVVYDSGFIVGMGLGTHFTDGGFAAQEMFVDLLPYNKDLQKLYPDTTRRERLSIPNIWEEAARSGLFAQVLGGICQVANLLAKEKRLVAQIAAAQAADPEADVTALETELAAVRGELLVVD